MNLNKIVCLALATVVSSHAFALEIYHGRVISEKTWSSDGQKVKLVKKHNLSRKMDNDKQQAQYITASIQTVSGSVGKPVTLDNYHELYVVNSAATNQTYRYTTSVCASVDENTTRCVYHSQDLSLDSGGYFREDTAPQLTMNYNTAGTYHASANTWLYANGDKSYGPASSMAATDIIIS